MITENELKENLEYVKGRILEAVKKSGRKEEDVKLISVSKTNPVEVLEYAVNAGVRVFGENKVQELVDKIDYF